MNKIVVLVSGGGTNLQRIIDAVSTGEIPATVVSKVIADRDCFALQRAATAGIDFALVPRGSDFTNNLGREIPDDTDLIVLAGFLSIIDENICTKFKNKIINLHPALLPKFGGKGMWGAHVHHAVLAQGEKRSGATVHFVTSGIDEGEIILQKTVSVSAGETAESLAEKIHAAEYEILPQAISLVLSKFIK